MPEAQQTVEIKICGITREEDARFAAAAGADYLGLVFAASPRRVSLERARSLATAVPGAAWVGVFAAADTGDILDAAAAVPFRVAQLHGVEDPAAVAELHARGVEVWQGLGVEEAADWPAVAARLEELPDEVDAVLLDRRAARRMGGGGVPFDWQGVPPRVRALLARRRFVLAGGLSPENVSAALQRLRPDAVDVSSGVELAPGCKDPERVRRFIDAVRTVANL